MKQLIRALLSLGRRGQHNIVKILCLAIGLAAGVVLMGKVGFEGSYDNFFPTSHRIYLVNETIVRDGDFKEFPQTAGAVAMGMKQYCPQVEAATRLTRVLSDFPLVTDDQRKLKATISLVDSCFFNVFPFTVLVGDARQTLSQPRYCMINRSLAEKLAGAGPLANVVGTRLYMGDVGNLDMTVGGIFEDIPLNSTFADEQVMLSMPTIGQLMWDGRSNWVGNDRYRSFLRLAEGTNPADMQPQITRMMEENIDLEELDEAGMELGYSLTPLTQFNTKSITMRRMMWILSILAFVLIFCAVMNYLLIVVGGVTRRAKEMAVHKCYGAERRNIYAMVLAESVVHLLLSAALAALLLLLFRDTVEHLTGAPLGVLLTCGSNLWMLSAVCLLVLVVTWLVPSWLYTHVPVAVAFRRYGKSHRQWKLCLLAMQFMSSAFLLALLFVVARQYSLMLNDHPGYDYHHLAISKQQGLSPAERQLVVSELRKLPCVESVTTSTMLLTDGQSGDNITLPDDPREYMNVADLYFTGDGYFQTMGIPVLQGRTFTEGTDTLCEMMVSRRFDERMCQLVGWDSSLGQQVHCSSFGDTRFTIVGIYEDVLLGSIAATDQRASVMFYRKNIDNQMPVITVRFQPISSEALAEANRLLERLLPGKEVSLKPYTLLMTELYTDSRHFRTTVLIGGLVTLFIALIGLIGYMAGEVLRRQKEIAIRKVNGAQTRQVLRLFLHDVLRVALPAVIAGGVGAFFVARLWLQQFSVKTSLTPWLFMGSGLLVLAVVVAVVVLGCWRVAAGNPSHYLKNE